MTDKIMEARRAKFQTWWRDDAQEELRKSCAQGWGEFVWNAALDSLCVELPAELHAKPYACYEGGWNDMRAEVADLLEFQGIKTK